MNTIDRDKLPASYLSWLDSKEAGQVEYQGKVWKLKKSDGLSEDLLIDGKRNPFHKALTNVAQSLVNMPAISVESGGTFDLSRLAEGFAIAEDNFDFLFIEADGSIWGFWHSALSVSHIASSFSDALIVPSVKRSISYGVPKDVIGK